jgi:hypothetical protein
MHERTERRNDRHFVAIQPAILQFCAHLSIGRSDFPTATTSRVILPRTLVVATTAVFFCAPAATMSYRVSPQALAQLQADPNRIREWANVPGSDD